MCSQTGSETLDYPPEKHLRDSELEKLVGLQILQVKQLMESAKKFSSSYNDCVLVKVLQCTVNGSRFRDPNRAVVEFVREPGNNVDVVIGLHARLGRCFHELIVLVQVYAKHQNHY